MVFVRVRVPKTEGMNLLYFVSLKCENGKTIQCMAMLTIEQYEIRLSCEGGTHCIESIAAGFSYTMYHSANILFHIVIVHFRIGHWHYYHISPFLLLLECTWSDRIEMKAIYHILVVVAFITELKMRCEFDMIFYLCSLYLCSFFIRSSMVSKAHEPWLKIYKRKHKNGAIRFSFFC